MVDAQLHMGRIILHVVLFAEQLDAGHIHRHHEGRGKAAVKGGDVHIIVHFGDGVAAQHRRGAAKALQRLAQRARAAHRVTVRVFVAQDQHLVGAAQAGGRRTAVHSFSHRGPLFSQPSLSGVSSVSRSRSRALICAA